MKNISIYIPCGSNVAEIDKFLKKNLPADKFIIIKNALPVIQTENINYDFLGLYYNKDQDPMVAIVKRDILYLLGEKYPLPFLSPKILFTHMETEKIHIDDIFAKHNNIGNGSASMEAFLFYAKQKNVKKIIGFISDIDMGHYDRLQHFYKKHGFIITKNSIKKEIY